MFIISINFLPYEFLNIVICLDIYYRVSFELDPFILILVIKYCEKLAYLLGFENFFL